MQEGTGGGPWVLSMEPSQGRTRRQPISDSLGGGAPRDPHRSPPRLCLPGSLASQYRGAVAVESSGLDRCPGVGGQFAHVGEVVDDDQADGGQLLGSGEVADVVAVVALAG